MGSVQEERRTKAKPFRPRPNPLAYRPQDAAEALGVSLSTIYGMIAKGQLEARKIGTTTVIHHSELIRILDSAPLSETTKRAQASIK